jgi:hypothetical protein
MKLIEKVVIVQMYVAVNVLGMKKDIAQKIA